MAACITKHYTVIFMKVIVFALRKLCEMDPGPRHSDVSGDAVSAGSCVVDGYLLLTCYTWRYNVHDERCLQRNFVSGIQKVNNKRQVDIRNPTCKAKQLVLILSCFLINFLAIGFVMGLGVIFVEVVDSLHTRHAQTTLMLTLCMGVTYSGALVAGPIVDKLKPGNSVILGGILAMVGCVGAAFAPNVHILIFTVGFITGCGFCFAHFSTYITVSSILNTGRGAGLAVITAGSGLGGFIFPIFNAHALHEFGWRGSFLLSAGILFHMCLFGMIVRMFTVGLVFESEMTDDESDKDQPCSKRLKLHLFKKVPFVVFLLCQIPLWSIFTGVMMLIADVAFDNGFDIDMSSYVLSSFTIAYVVGSLCGGGLNSSFKISGLVLVSTSSFGCSVASVCFVFVKRYAFLVTISVALGLCIGILDVSMPICTHEISGKATYSRALSYLFGVMGISDIISGPICGYLRDLTGDYKVVFYAATGLGIAAGVAFAVLFGIARKRTKLSTAKSKE